jgi:uncharacterized protein (DUF302 family)
VLHRGIAVAATFAALASASASEPVRIDRVSDRSFEETLQQMEWALGGHALTILERLDYRSLLGKERESLRKSLLLLVLRRDWGTILVENDPSAALALPFHIHLYEEADGKTVVSYYRPSSLFPLDADSRLQALGEEMDAAFQAVVRVASERRGHRD